MQTFFFGNALYSQSSSSSSFPMNSLHLHPAQWSYAGVLRCEWAAGYPWSPRQATSALPSLALFSGIYSNMIVWGWKWLYKAHIRWSSMKYFQKKMAAGITLMLVVSMYILCNCPRIDFLQRKNASHPHQWNVKLSLKRRWESHGLTAGSQHFT